MSGRSCCVLGDQPGGAQQLNQSSYNMDLDWHIENLRYPWMVQ